MSDSGNRRQRATGKCWIYWGASGVLQPLSEAFLYRSPADCARRRDIRAMLAMRGKTDAVR